jgi:hypothetical protein
MTAGFEAIFSIVAYMAGLAAIFVGLGLTFQRRFQIRPVDLNMTSEVLAHPLPHGRGSVAEPRASVSGHSQVVVTLCLDQCLAAFWIGFAATICFLQIWHLFLAITWRALLIVVLCGAAGLWWNRTLLAAWVRTLTRNNLTPAILFTLLAAAWVANHSAGPPTAFDSAMYHAPAVRWYTSYPVVLGLGNLHDRLAFNTSSLLYDAMLECGPWVGRASHVANGLLVLVLLLQILTSAVRAFRARGDNMAPYLFDLVLLPPVLAIVVSEDISSFTTDVPPAIVLFVACSQAYRLLSMRCSELLTASSAVVLVILAVLAATLKASYILMAGLLVLTAAASLIRQASKPVIVRAGKWSVAIAVFGIVPWIINSVLLSGYPLYPSTFGGLPVDWKVPEDLATAQRLWIAAHARHSIADGFMWVGPWLKHILHWSYNNEVGQAGSGILGVLIPLSIVVVSLLAAVVVGRKRLAVCLQNNGWWLIPVCDLATLFWFLVAPGPRFGFAILWSLAAVCVAQSIGLYRPWVRRLALPVALAMACIPLIFPLPQSDVLRSLIARSFITPGPDHGLYPYPKPELSRFTTQSGLMLYVPVNDNRCYDAPLPCTPHPAPNVVLIEGADGRPKFITEGSWQQINWPNPSGDPFKKAFLKRLRMRLGRQ